MMNFIVSDINNCEAYIDDVVVYANEFHTHVKQINQLFSNLAKGTLTVNLFKSDVFKVTITYLGYQVRNSQMRHVRAKVDAILNVPHPRNCKDVRMFFRDGGIL